MLGTRAGFFVDLFLVLLLALLPIMLVAVRLVRRGRIRAHARLMVGSYIAFLLALIAFEVAVRVSEMPPLPPLAMTVHLVFAIPCFVAWTLQVLRSRDAVQNAARHRNRGKLVLALLVATVATGTWVYLATFA